MALPCTTPLLGGARARLSRNRGIELIVRNPAGGRGVYVMPLSSITTLCRPTQHDKVLCNRIAFLDNVTPATVRAVSWAAAAEGLAGEGAMQAAKQAVKTEAADRRAVVHKLLSTLTRQVSTGVNGSPGPASPDLDARAQQTIAWLAPRLGQSAGWGIKALDAIADTMTGVGIAGDVDVGRIPGLIALLGTMREQIAEWADTQRDGDRVLCAHTVCSAADFVRTSAATMVARTRTLTDDMVGLLRLWAADPDAVIRIAERPDWLLDGWQQICLIWNYAADSAARRMALVEIAEQIPTIPKELNEWGGRRTNVDDVFAESGHIALNEDWRTGAAVFDLIARNEQLRAAVF